MDSAFRNPNITCSLQSPNCLAPLLRSWCPRQDGAREKARLPLGPRDAVELAKPLLAVLVLLEKPEM